jgi:hypothetical protein
MRFKAAPALLAGLTIAVAAGTSTAAARTSPPSPFGELGRSIERLFAQTPVRRHARKTAKLAPVPYPRARPAELRPTVRAAPGPQKAAAPPPKPVATGVPVSAPRPVPAPAKEPPIPDAPDARAAGEVQTGPSACRLRLTPQIAVVHTIEAIHGPGQCGGEDLVRLEAVVLKDGRRVALAPAATMRCRMAEAVAQWLREDALSADAALPSPPRTLVTAASYECRGRNRVAGATLSEHGKANALDVRGFALADGSRLDFTDRSAAKATREHLRRTACARFKTVLGPGSDGYHEDHVHLDLRERRGGFAMCQWDVAVPAEVASVPLPPERPRKGKPATE